jgi:FlaA1/EpsC-like NDP-sugar epimerase
VLVVGGAGSIGSATIRQLVRYRPESVHVVDQNENSLVELVRDLRSGTDPLQVPDFRTLPLDYGAPVMERFLASVPSYDMVLNFAAHKHVRSEKDVCSLLQMLDTNIVKQARFLGWLRRYGHGTRTFAVSTDKAAFPVNLMGASKRLMEHVIFSEGMDKLRNRVTTSARFANVAFSNGSLLEGFLHRLAKRQPFALPRATRRFFVSLDESAHLCLLAASLFPDRHLAIPALDERRDLIELEEVGVKVLAHFGYKAVIFEDEAAAKENLAALEAKQKYPVLLTALDTSGEKAFEEFVGDGEQSVDLKFKALRGVPYRSVPPATLEDVVARLSDLIHDASKVIGKTEIVSIIAKTIPEFKHVETGKSLDQTM